ncbi:hypothetical protein ES702_07039 [subsurface metagenome]
MQYVGNLRADENSGRTAGFTELSRRESAESVGVIFCGWATNESEP